MQQNPAWIQQGGGSPSCSHLSADNWANKAIRRNTTGSGRCRYLKTMARKAKNGFREGACETFPLPNPPSLHSAWGALVHTLSRERAFQQCSGVELLIAGCPLVSGTTAQKKQ